MFGQPLFFSGSIQFFSSFFVTYGTPCCARGRHSHLIFCDLRDTMPWQRQLLSSLTTFVTYRTLCYTRGHESHFLSNPYLGKPEDFPMGGKYPKDVPLPTCLDYLQPF